MNRVGRTPLDRALDFAADIGTDALVVQDRGGRILVRGDVKTPRIIASVRKAVMALLVGTLIDDGLLDLQASLRDLGIDDTEPLTEIEQSATVEHLLQSRSGIYLVAASETTAMRESRPPRGSHRPGEYFWYNNWGFNALVTVIEQASGEGLAEYFDRRYAQPLGFEHFDPVTCVDTVTVETSRHVAKQLFLSAIDLSRLGRLVLEAGSWQGQRIVSETWVRRCLRPYSPLGGSAFGYCWWIFDSDQLSTKMYAALGRQGSRSLSVLPGRGLVVAHRATEPLPGGFTPVKSLIDRLVEALPTGSGADEFDD